MLKTSKADYNILWCAKTQISSHMLLGCAALSSLICLFCAQSHSQLLTVHITTVSLFTTFIVSCKFGTLLHVYKPRLVKDFRFASTLVENIRFAPTFGWRYPGSLYVWLKISGLPVLLVEYFRFASAFGWRYPGSLCVWLKISGLPLRLVKISGLPLRLIEDFRKEWAVYLFCTASRLDLELTWPPIEWSSGFIFPYIERPGREAGHIPPFFSRLRMCGFMSSLSSLCGTFTAVSLLTEDRAVDLRNVTGSFGRMRK
jgi:hypothetical protein